MQVYTSAMSGERIPAIIGIGSAVGKNIIGNDQIAERLGRKPATIDRMMRPVGIKTRYWRKDGETTSDLSVEALTEALAMAKIEKSDLKTVLVCTSSPDYLGVPVASMIQEKLGLPMNIRFCDITAACTGWVQGLYNTFVDLTSPLGRGGLQAVLGAEVTSPTLSVKQQNVYLLFGDAAGATIVDLVKPDSGAPTNISFAFGGEGSYAKKLYVPAGGSKYPASQETIDNDMHSVHMEGEVVKEAAIKWMVEKTEEVLEKAGVPKEEVALFIPHQANLEIIEKTAEELNFPWEKVMITVDHFGNTSAASIPTALREAWDKGRIKRNDMLAFATFGAGFTFAAGVIPMVGLPRPPNRRVTFL